MKSRFAFLAAMALLTLGALAFRLPELGNRPMHGDEAVHAFKFRELWETGVYRYDPNEFHGPTLYYAALPSVLLQQKRNFAATTEADYRLPIVVFGAAMVLLLVLFADDGLGRSAMLWAGLLLAISPAFVFYSRYYIQEILLAFFTLGAMACGWRYIRDQSLRWCVGAGLCAGLMVASKETAVLAFVAFAGATGCSVLWARLVDRRTLDLRPYWNGRHGLLAVALGTVVACLFLSGFCTHLSGPLDYLRSYAPWLSRAHGTTIHLHPWSYYLQILMGRLPGGSSERRGPICSELLIVVLAMVGAVSALLPRTIWRFSGRQNLTRWIVFYTVLLTVLYSLIPYKTPWCLLSFLTGMILLAGVGAAALVSLVPGRLAKVAAGLLLLVGCSNLAWQSYTASYLAFTDARNPYVYAQPVPDIVELQHRLEALAAASPQREKLPIFVFSVDSYYWPVPWYLRRFPNVGYWTQLPANADAPIVLASPEYDDALSRKLDATHLMTGYRGLRPGVFLEVWVRLDLWKAYLDKRKLQSKEDPGS